MGNVIPSRVYSECSRIIAERNSRRGFVPIRRHRRNAENSSLKAKDTDGTHHRNKQCSGGYQSLPCHYEAHEVSPSPRPWRACRDCQNDYSAGERQGWTHRGRSATEEPNGGPPFPIDRGLGVHCTGAILLAHAGYGLANPTSNTQVSPLPARITSENIDCTESTQRYLIRSGTTPGESAAHTMT